MPGKKPVRPGLGTLGHNLADDSVNVKANLVARENAAPEEKELIEGAKSKGPNVFKKPKGVFVASPKQEQDKLLSSNKEKPDVTPTIDSDTKRPKTKR